MQYLDKLKAALHVVYEPLVFHLPFLEFFFALLTGLNLAIALSMISGC
jgi:hypothetical protein